MIRLGQLDVAVLFSATLAHDLSCTPLLEEELFILLPENSALVPKGMKEITLAQAAELPLILPTSVHGLRQRISNEFESRNLTPRIAVEIDSLSLLMACVWSDMGATIKPMSALFLERERGRHWRSLRISDASITRRNYLYTAPSQTLSPAANIIASEIRNTTKWLVDSGELNTVKLLF
jgi:LysR family tcuABC transcriptional regulator